jgi:tyrosinase
MTSRSLFSRRSVLQHLGAAGIAAAGLDFTAAASRAACPMRVRRNIDDAQFGAAAADAYREVVGKLKALPSSDARNWFNLAEIHRKFCPHGNWYLLPWHRAYLSAVEDICAEVTGNPSFALPYWDWTTFRQLPRPLVDEKIDGKDNPLFHRARKMRKHDTLATMLSPFGVDADVIFGEANIAAIKRQPKFQLFGSMRPPGHDSTDPSRLQYAHGRKTKLEAEPHDFLHGAVGGDMDNKIGAARDPIFYLHHANLDRIWDDWRVNHADEDDPLWTDFAFKGNFPTATGARGGDIVVSNLQSSAALCYAYDTGRVPARDRPLGESVPVRTLGVGVAPGRVTVAMANEVSIPLSHAMRTAPGEPVGIATVDKKAMVPVAVPSQAGGAGSDGVIVIETSGVEGNGKRIALSGNVVLKINTGPAEERVLLGRFFVSPRSRDPMSYAFDLSNNADITAAMVAAVKAGKAEAEIAITAAESDRRNAARIRLPVQKSYLEAPSGDK